MVGQLFNVQLLHIPLGVPKTAKFRQGRGGAFRSPNYWNTVVLTIDLPCFYFKNFIFKDSCPEMTYISGSEREFLSYTHTRTPSCANIHTHTHIHTQLDFLDFSANYGAHTPLFIPEFDSHQVLICLLVTTSIMFSI